MRDTLQNIVSHTYDLGIVDQIKVVGTPTETKIEGLAEDKTVVIYGSLTEPVSEFLGTFGMPNLGRMKTLLNIPLYQDKATEITVSRNDSEEPVGLHFKAAGGVKFENDYRFMSSQIAAERIRSVTFRGTTWEVAVTPTLKSLQQLKYQAQVNTDETAFNASTVDGNLVFSFGDRSTHAGSFVFATDVTGKLSKPVAFPIKQVIGILDLVGDKTMSISANAMEIRVVSAMSEYVYILPAFSK